jgi:23S rRNA pseudouridine1911/1915/1917 synthase
VNLEILYEDNHLIAVNKKPGDIVQGDKTGDEPLSEKIKNYIKVKYNKPGDAFLGTIHRIDRPVSGVVLFARTGKALERMNEQFRERKVKKIYWAVVKNRPDPPSGTIKGYLVKDESKNKSREYKEPRNGALLSELEYSTLNHSDKYSLVEINPLTGRHHQIRVQLSGIGCPIKGDLKYGFDRSNKDGSIHLHARKLTFEHPVNKSIVEILAAPPDETLWNFFSARV